MKWEDLPPTPWPPETEPPTEQLADWLTSLSREQLVFVLAHQRQTWAQDSRCFIENHHGRLEQADATVADAAAHWQRGYDQGIADAVHVVGLS